MLRSGPFHFGHKRRGKKILAVSVHTYKNYTLYFPKARAKQNFQTSPHSQAYLQIIKNKTQTTVANYKKGFSRSRKSSQNS